MRDLATANHCSSWSVGGNENQLSFFGPQLTVSWKTSDLNVISGSMAVLGEPRLPWAFLARATELEHRCMSLESASRVRTTLFY